MAGYCHRAREQRDQLQQHDSQSGDRQR
uniref:Uncharacterized protein n=1 Tax=Anguilla anguilla TaxID=7936 RepID=A0A0E9XLP6_ANGAN